MANAISSTPFTTSTLRTSPCLRSPGFRSSRADAFDVEELASHGGSLRMFGCPKETERTRIQPGVAESIAWAGQAGQASLADYAGFDATGCAGPSGALLRFLSRRSEEG